MSRDVCVVDTEGHVCVGRHRGICVCGEAPRDVCVLGGTEGRVCGGHGGTCVCGGHGRTCVCGEALRDVCVYGGTEGHVCGVGHRGTCVCGEVYMYVLKSNLFLLNPHTPAMTGFIYTIVILQLKHYNMPETILRAFDVITIVVPPALPAALTVGTVYALNRLRRQKIYCISPQR